MSDAFERARAWFLEGVQHVEAGRATEAERCFETSLALLPGRASTLTNLGAVRLKLGRIAEALPLLEQALALEPHNLEAWAHRGVALAQLGRDADALPCFEHALALDGDHAATLYQTALTLGRLQRHGDALQRLDHLLASHPAHVEGWLLQGQTLQQAGRHDAALPSYERALALRPDHAWAWSLRGGLLKDQGRRAEAAAAFEQAIAHGGDAALNRFFLAALAEPGASGPAVEPPARTPDAYVRLLFDGYAEGFDEHLVQVLNYRAHRGVAERLAGTGRRFDSVLDLGCGTGLLGPLLAPLADRIDGVDLSPPMLAKARALGIYDRLDAAELVDHLQHTERRHDAVVAADVFIYVGQLDAVFAGVQRVLEPGGCFAFSVERTDDARDFVLQPSLRYAHSERGLRELARQAGFDVLGIEPGLIREDQREPIAGLYALLQRH